MRFVDNNIHFPRASPVFKDLTQFSPSGKYVGKNGALITVSWGAVTFSYKINHSDMSSSSYGEAFNFMMDIKKYIMGRPNNLNFSNPYPY